MPISAISSRVATTALRAASASVIPGEPAPSARATAACRAGSASRLNSSTKGRKAEQASPWGVSNRPPRLSPMQWTAPTSALPKARPASRLARACRVARRCCPRRRPPPAASGNQLDGTERQDVADGVRHLAGVGLDGMDQGVHAGRGRGCRGQREREVGVEDRHVRRDDGVEQAHLVVVVFVGDDGDPRHLATRTGRGGHGDQRQGGPSRSRSPPSP